MNDAPLQSWLPGARRNRRLSVALAVASGSLAITASAAAAGASTRLASTPRSSSKTVNLVAYSTPEAAYSALIKAFGKTHAGKGVNVVSSFGPSGSQATAVLNGQPADVVNFSSEPDMAKLVKAGLVSSKWDTVGPEQGMVTNSVVAIVVRKGNPLHIHTWADLVKKGIKLLTPNPFSSGSARWNLMAAYGAEISLGVKPKKADKYLYQLLKHAVSQPASASDAMTDFTEGTGNALLDYESDAIAAQRKGADISYVIPPQDILIQNPLAVLKKSESNRAAKAFFNYLLSKPAQKIWAKQGYRPVVASAAKAAGVHFPTPRKLFRIGWLGGWTSVTKKFFASKTGIITKIEESLGQSTSG